jgi:hypothetical protein
MTNLSIKQKRLLFGAAALIVLGMIGASVYKPETYAEYIARKKGITQEKEVKASSGPQAAVENFLDASLSEDPSIALQYLGNYDKSISSLESINRFLDLEIPLSFRYTIKDVTFTNSTGKVVVDLITPSGALEKELSLENIDGQWKLTAVVSNNNNQFIFSDISGSLVMQLPQEMITQKADLGTGDTYTISNPEDSIQIIILITEQDISEMFSELIDCTKSTCLEKEINGTMFDTSEMYDQASGEYAFTARAEKEGKYFTIMGIATQKESLETLKTVIGTVKI